MISEKINNKEIKKIYELIGSYHHKYLKKFGVGLPKLYSSDGSYTKDGLVLVYLSIGYPNTKMVSKTELTKFIRKYFPDVNDVQQARHLGAQKGWWIVAGGRDNVVRSVPLGSYQLHTLEKPYPSYHGHRIINTENWEEIRAQYGDRCATCGSKNGERNFHWPETMTKLQKAHMDPNKPLVKGNIIPQCQKCNRADRNRWVYDERGRVIKLAKPSFIKNSDKDVRQKVYKILQKEFKGTGPDAK